MLLRRFVCAWLLGPLLGLLLVSGLAAPREVAASEPGQVVKEAFDLLMDRFVTPPSSAALLGAGWDAAQDFLSKQGIQGLPDQRPALSGDRAAARQAFSTSYAQLAPLAAGRLEPWQLDRATIRGMAAALNSLATRYLAPEQLATPTAQARYGGIGLRPAPGFIVSEVFPSGPAEAGGIRVGDQLLAVDGLPVDGGSRGQSEVLAAALRENGVSRVIGTRTAGYVDGGPSFPLSDGSRLIVTTMIVKSGQGQTLDGIGVEPDQIVEPDLQKVRAGRDNQLEAAAEYLRSH